MEEFSQLEILIADLARRGISLRAEGERLRYSAPPGSLTPELLAVLKASKTELIAFLRDRHSSSSTEPSVRMYPPSFTQRRFWTLQRLNPADSFYNVPFVFQLHGPLDAGILRESFNAVVHRHDALRTTLQEVDGELMQVVSAAGEITWGADDLRCCPADTRAAAVTRSLQTHMQQPFDLAGEAGLRVLLLRLDVDDHILQLCFHNTLFDQNSLLVLLKEISLHYAALLAGTPTALPPPTQYSEYVCWQESLEASGMEDRLNYWREWFNRGDPPNWTGATPKPTPGVSGFHSHVTWQRLFGDLAGQIQTFSKGNGVTSLASARPDTEIRPSGPATARSPVRYQLSAGACCSQPPFSSI